MGHRNMREYLFTDLQSVTPEELAEDLESLPQFRRDKALSYRFHNDRVQSVKAYLMLRKALREDFGISEDPVFEYASGGKPFLAEYPDIHFSLSHCRNAVLCVVGSGEAGCDVEAVEPSLDLDICRHCFNDGETARILAAPEPCLEFAKLWTIKESFLKFTGEGLVEDLPSLLTSGRLPEGLTFSTRVSPARDFVWTVCETTLP